ncbi:MAG: type II toxin-antitoxin system CcdA family antitoxin [Rhodoferax sp.]|nr:type II toxin-antitoxin system CcdA family antitoxin [Rhodoferax sp.]
MPAASTATGATTRKRAVNLTLNEGLVAQAKTYTSNLSATMEALLAAYVAQQQQTRLARQEQADSISMDWNAVHAAVGSFADEHCTL